MRDPLRAYLKYETAFTDMCVCVFACVYDTFRTYPWQLRALWSTESSEYHPVLEKRSCMDEYDVEMSYR